MAISVVICSFQRPQDLRNLLESLVQQTLLPQEVVIVDQSTDDRTRKLIQGYACRPSFGIDRWTYVHQREKSLVKARNRGIKQATGDIVSFLDDDVVPLKDYLEVVWRYFQDSSVGGVTGNLVVPQPLKGLKWEMRKLLSRIFLINSFDGRMTPSSFGYPIFEEVKELREVELFNGYSMNFRRELVEREPSDEWFSGYSFREDVDLSYRISRHSRLVLAPDARFHHNYSPANRPDVRDLQRMAFRNYLYLFKKHRSETLWYKFLFGYSVFGILFMEFLGFLVNWNRRRLDAISDAIAALRRGIA